MDYINRSRLAHQWAIAIDRQTINGQVLALVNRAKALKPGARRLLLKLHRLLEQTDFQPITRSEVAAALQHTKLHRYDLKLMNELIAARFIQVERFALPKHSNGMPRGSEYRYTMNVDTGWMLSHARKH